MTTLHILGLKTLPKNINGTLYLFKIYVWKSCKSVFFQISLLQIIISFAKLIFSDKNFIILNLLPYKPPDFIWYLTWIWTQIKVFLNKKNLHSNFIQNLSNVNKCSWAEFFHFHGRFHLDFYQVWKRIISPLLCY